MIDALCYGKLGRDVQGMEDLLTSAVFGRLRYLPLNEGLLPFLYQARYPDGRTVFPASLQLKTAHYSFWPWWKFGGSAGAEPDVVIELSTGADKYTVLVEAKFRSFKSSEAEPELVAPVDQLAREWDQLIWHCNESKSFPVMIYLTADFGMPRDEMAESAADFTAKRPDSAHPFRCGWLSWRHLPIALQGNATLIAADILRLVERHDLTLFHGISRVREFGWDWHFSAKSEFDFSYIATAQWSWGFANGK